MDVVHRFVEAQPEVWRWWTDVAHEFAAVARTIRFTRLLAHYKSTPCWPQASGCAERTNGFMIEGARCHFNDQRPQLELLGVCHHYVRYDVLCDLPSRRRIDVVAKTIAGIS